MNKHHYDPEFYQSSKPEKFYDECCVADIYLDGDQVAKHRIDFKYTVKDDGYADVIVTKIHEDKVLGTASDLRFDITVAIGDRINRKINEISWQ